MSEEEKTHLLIEMYYIAKNGYGTSENRVLQLNLPVINGMTEQTIAFASAVLSQQMLKIFSFTAEPYQAQQDQEEQDND